MKELAYNTRRWGTMPMIFFDLIDGTGQHFDDTGLDLPDIDSAQRAVEMSLPRISADKAIGCGPRFTIGMKVRDDRDREVISAYLDWTVHRHAQTPVV